MFYPPFRFHVAQMIPIHHANATLLPICPESGHPPPKNESLIKPCCQEEGAHDGK